jgi:hypothetical protein
LAIAAGVMFTGCDFGSPVTTSGVGVTVALAIENLL